jgi:hypothetical protein
MKYAGRWIDNLSIMDSFRHCVLGMNDSDDDDDDDDDSSQLFSIIKYILYIYHNTQEP